MNAEIISMADGKISISVPYNVEFISALKAEIPLNSRWWDGIKKIWVIEAEEAEAAVAVATRFYSILDRRIMSAAAVDNAKIEAEMAKIQDDQAFFQRNEADIDLIIDAIDEKIGSYSYASSSSVKASLAQDRAIFAHCLRNARQPVEELVEIQVRGMAAARRRLTQGTFPHGWPPETWDVWKRIE